MTSGYSRMEDRFAGAMQGERKESKNMEEKIKKVDERTELKDEEVDQVAGGYSRKTWKSMSAEERIAAQKKSEAYRILKEYCAMDDPNA